MGFNWLPKSLRRGDTDPRDDGIIALDNQLIEFFELLDDIDEKEMELQQAVSEYDKYRLSKPEEDIEQLVPDLYDLWLDAGDMSLELQEEMEDIFGDPRRSDVVPDVWKVYNELEFYEDLAQKRIPTLEQDQQLVEESVDQYIEHRDQQNHGIRDPDEVE